MSGDEITADQRGSGAVTLSDVARHAGVSPMTVSRVLSGGRSVSKDKRERVERSIKALQYRRNENARSLRPGQRSGMVGVIVTNISNPYYAGVLEGIEEIVDAHGRRVLIGATHEDVSIERKLLADFIGRQIEGLIVVPVGGDPAHLSKDNIGEIPLVLASRAQPGVDVDTVLIDDVRGAVMGTEILLREGHTRIAFVGNAASVFTGQRRFDGFVQAHTLHGIDYDPNLVRHGQQDVQSAERAISELLALPNPPTAVFSTNNRNTVGILRILAQRGDLPLLRIVAFDNFDLSDVVPTPVTIIDHDARELGRTAAELLIERLDGPRKDRPARRVELPTYLLGQAEEQAAAMEKGPSFALSDPETEEAAQIEPVST